MSVREIAHNPIPYLIWVGVGFMAVIFVFFPEAANAHLQ